LNVLKSFAQSAKAAGIELWTLFGDLAEIWFDGGYTQAMKSRITALLAKTQPNACTWNGYGVGANPVRWDGNESGQPPGWPTIWSTSCNGAYGQGCSPDSPGASWYPSGLDATLQANDVWFYVEGTPLNSMSTLVAYYHYTAGANGVLELDFAIDRTGQVHPAHAALYQQFGNWIRTCYSHPVAIASNAAGSMELELQFGKTASIDRLMMQEDQALGQFIIDYQVWN